MPNKLESMLDPLHKSFNLFDDPFCKEIWQARYAAKGETSIYDTFQRVVAATYAKDPRRDEFQGDAGDALSLGLFLPAGRILNSAGLDSKSTGHNCFVSTTIEDSVEGIHRALSEAMITLSRFGGIGMDFSPIRPKGAKVGSQGLVSAGVLNWMSLWHEGAERIMQSGHRRGAMMGTLDISHPDILDFIEAKRSKGQLTNFNISVLVSDAFMKAVENNEEWVLYHKAEPAVSSLGIGAVHDMYHEGPNFNMYIYKRLRARELWEKILRNTHEFSEPGVIFIDRVNKENNLGYCENIRCCNPCGEQFLAPYGACNLGHLNLARMVNRPFTPYSNINWPLLNATIAIAVRFLDNIIDVSNFPLEAQKDEQIAKRLLGLGVTGLADMLMQMGVNYNSASAIDMTDKVMEFIAENVYSESRELAKERGTFPAWKAKFGQQGFAGKLRTVKLFGNKTRNGRILTVAPTGTVSIVFGNVSSGIEPCFAFKQNRKVWVDNKKQETHPNESFIKRFYHHVSGYHIEQYPHAQTMKDVSALDQVRMQAIVQKWIDASVSKTVSVAQDISFIDFEEVYNVAYNVGCKGCTTYRPSEIRGSVIDNADDDNNDNRTSFPIADMGANEYMSANEYIEPWPTPAPIEQYTFSPKYKRPEALPGITIKLKWPGLEDNAFLTITEENGRPAEIFISSRDLKNIEWSTIACIMASRCLRNNENPLDIAKYFKGIQGAHDGHFIGDRYYTSLPQFIGYKLEEHFLKYTQEEVTQPIDPPSPAEKLFSHLRNPICPKCAAPSLEVKEGCKTCSNCGWSQC